MTERRTAARMIVLDPDRWRLLDGLLAEALERDPGERDDWLRAACGSDRGLREELRALLDGSDEAAREIGESAAAFAASLLAAEEPGDLAPGDRVGPYRIEAELGRGGMGVVYRAARADGAFEKAVALKLVRRGLTGRDAMEQFRHERQVLAALDHPGIGRLLDGGTAPDGRPYLVMEYVEGEPVTAYCDRRRLSVESRLALFEEVCEAVDHAHRRLVVHRDLKPANILISDSEGGVPRPKLLDFGIAGLLEADLEGARTSAARRLTPAYAAPEQARGEAVTTAADVYALGVVLHELLAGERPGRPPRPPGAAASPEAAASGQTTPRGLRRRCRGDLDAIVARALREDPRERYPSVESLLDDLRRHRSGHPVLARADSAGYRARKFVRRHRTGTTVGAGWAILLLVGGLLYATGIEREKRVAQEEARRAGLMANVMRDLFETADPYTLSTMSGDSLLLVRGREAVERDLAGEPELQVRMLTTLGRVYRERGEYDQAGLLFDRALAIARGTRAAPHPSVVELLREAGGLATDRIEYAEAIRHYREMVAMQRALHGEDDPSTMTGSSLLAQVEALAGRMEESERMHREIVERSRRIHPPTDPAHVYAVWKLARVLYMRGKFAESEAALREVLDLRRRSLGEEHPQVAHALHWLGLVLTDRGKFEASEAVLREALDMRRRLFGAEHGEVAESLFGLGLLASERGDFEAAATLIGRSVETSRRVLGDGHRDTAFRTQILGEIYLHSGDHERALALLDEALAIHRRTLGEDHARGRGALASKARALSEAGSYAAAEAAFGEVLSLGAEADPPRGRSYHEARAGYGELLVRTGRAVAAEPLLREAVAALETRTAARHDRSVLYAKTALGEALAAQGRRAEARRILEEVLAVTSDHYGPANSRTLRARRALSELGA